MANIKVDKENLFQLLEYTELMGEKKHYEENGRPKYHIYLTIRQIMKQVKYEEVQ